VGINEEAVMLEHQESLPSRQSQGGSWLLTQAADLTDAELTATVINLPDPLDPRRSAMGSKPATVGVMCTTPMICNC
jgi:hypothetical protein